MGYVYALCIVITMKASDVMFMLEYIRKILQSPKLGLLLVNLRSAKQSYTVVEEILNLTENYYKWVDLYFYVTKKAYDQSYVNDTTIEIPH